MAHNPIEGSPKPAAYKRLDAKAEYPGRGRVMSRDSARDYLFDQNVRADSPDKYACTQPFEVSAIGLPSQFEGKGPLPLTLVNRCRKCANCLLHRRRLWTARAIDEIAAANRTWFGTLTVSPENRFAMMLRAERAKLRASREAFSSLGITEQFSLLSRAMGVEITLWLKRLRAAHPEPFRYLLVMEAHKDGFPHGHVLIHEGVTPITKRKLEDQWRSGFSHWRLVGDDPRAASYVCKYLNKSALSRVRGSQRYGRGGQAAAITERLESATHSLLGVVKREAHVQAESSGKLASKKGGERESLERSEDFPPVV